MQKHIRILAKVPEFVPLIHLIEAPATYLLWQTISCRHLKCPRMQFGNMVFQKFVVSEPSKMIQTVLITLSWVHLKNEKHPHKELSW